ncbi:hypothetical protein EV1_028234 [Malus domestica]
MRMHGERIDDVIIIERILRFMISKYDYVVCSIEESNDLDTINEEEVEAEALIEEEEDDGVGLGSTNLT